MLGVLLARAGVQVTVLEKHADFLRDFRGDTIHPSTLELMYELGWLDDFLKLPHEKVAQLAAQFGEETLAIADFSHLPVHCPFIAMMPQWDFLNFLAERGRRYAGFDLRMEAQALSLIEEGGRVAGVRAKTPNGAIRYPGRPRRRRRWPPLRSARGRGSGRGGLRRAHGRALVSPPA